jgi:peptidoglycan/LPS O-acetylase OafA/YrhL
VAAVLFLSCGIVQRGLPSMSPFTGTIGHSMLAVSFALLVLCLAQMDADTRKPLAWWQRAWHSAPLRLLARYSYGMYVFHKILGDAIGRPLMRAHPAWLKSIPANMTYLVLGTLASLGAAMLSYHLLEKRFLQLKPLLARRGAVPVAST